MLTFIFPPGKQSRAATIQLSAKIILTGCLFGVKCRDCSLLTLADSGYQELHNARRFMVRPRVIMDTCVVVSSRNYQALLLIVQTNNMTPHCSGLNSQVTQIKL